MMFIPGWVISLLTFPGVIVHELAHEFFCRKFGVLVYEVRYFVPLGNPAGYVLHGKPKTYGQAFWISVGPFVINSITAIIIAFTPITLLFDLGVFKLGFLNGLLLWLGVSIGMNAFPSSQDAKCLISHSNKACQKGNFWGFLGYPVAGLIHLLNLGSVVWLDLAFALGVIYIVPRLTIFIISPYIH